MHTFPGERMQHEKPESQVAKAHRINNRWIVHGNLRDNANAYLDHLSSTDPLRLERSCSIAMDLVHKRRALNDPKPLFYAGLFSLATEAEIERFLQGHHFTRSVIRRARGGACDAGFPEDTAKLAETVAEMVRTISPRPSD